MLPLILEDFDVSHLGIQNFPAMFAFFGERLDFFGTKGASGRGHIDGEPRDVDDTSLRFLSGRGGLMPEFLQWVGDVKGQGYN
jgi:hypothetical protein